MWKTLSIIQAAIWSSEVRVLWWKEQKKPTVQTLIASNAFQNYTAINMTISINQNFNFFSDKSTEPFSSLQSEIINMRRFFSSSFFFFGELRDLALFETHVLNADSKHTSKGQHL